MRFNRGPEKRLKTVVYFWHEQTAIVLNYSYEHTRVFSGSYEQALKRLTFENARQLCAERKVIASMSTQQPNTEQLGHRFMKVH